MTPDPINYVGLIHNSKFRNDVWSILVDFKEAYKKEKDGKSYYVMSKYIKDSLSVIERCCNTTEYDTDLWKSLLIEVDRMPGFWSFLNPIRPLTLSIKKILLEMYPIINVMKNDITWSKQVIRELIRGAQDAEEKMKDVEVKIATLRSMHRNNVTNDKFLYMNEVEQCRADFFESQSGKLEEENRHLIKDISFLTEKVTDLNQKVAFLEKENFNLTKDRLEAIEICRRIQEQFNEEKKKHAAYFQKMSEMLFELKSEVNQLRRDNQKFTDNSNSQVNKTDEIENNNSEDDQIKVNLDELIKQSNQRVINANINGTPEVTDSVILPIKPPINKAKSNSEISKARFSFHK